MVYADLEQARKRLDASAQSRILQRPDGVARTWSGRIAAWPQDSVHSWQELVKLAGKRMYQAKNTGKAHLCAE